MASNSDENNIPNAQNSGAKSEDNELAGAYVDYIRSRRKEMGDSVTTAMQKLGLLFPAAPKQQSASNKEPHLTASGKQLSGAAAAVREMRKQHSEGTLTFYGKKVKRDNRGALAARLLVQKKQVDAGQQATVHHLDGSHWRLEANGDWRYFVPGGNPGGDLWEGTIEADDAGTIVFQQDQMSFTRYADGRKALKFDSSIVEADSRGFISCVTYDDGRKRFFEFDTDGQLSAVRVDKEIWKRKAEQQWDLCDDSAGVIKSLKADLSVDKIGNFIFLDYEASSRTTETPDGMVVKELADGYKTTMHRGLRLVLCPDGARIQMMPDGTIVTENNQGTIVRKPSGVCIEYGLDKCINRIERSDKKIRDQMRFQSNGELIEFKDYDGTIWHRGPANSWIQYDSKLEETGFSALAKIDVDEQGGFTYSKDAKTVYETPDGKLLLGNESVGQKEENTAGRTAVDLLNSYFGLIVRTPVESEVVDTPTKPENNRQSILDSVPQRKVINGYTIEFDQKGRVAYLEFGDGSWRRFHYDEQDEIIAFDENQKSTRRNADSSWTSYAGEEELGDAAPSRAIADRNGQFKLEYLDNGTQTIWRSDGSLARLNADGKLEAYISARGRRFKVDPVHSVAEYTMQENESLHDVIADLIALRHWRETHRQATKAELEQLSNRILSMNDIEDPDKLVDEFLVMPLS